MNRTFPWAAALLGLAAVAAPAPAQYVPPGVPAIQPSDVDFVQKVRAAPSPAADMQEDIEIMRRLLDGAFAEEYGFHGKGGSPFIFNFNAPIVTTHNTYPQQPGQGWSGIVGHPVPQTEGVYLKDYGVVYTATLPYTGFDPLPRNDPGTGGKAPPDDWDRIRKEIHGETPDQPGKTVPAHKPLSEVILKALADNGKHFSALADGERISVAVTFRGAANCANCHQNPWNPGQPNLPLTTWQALPDGWYNYANKSDSRGTPGSPTQQGQPAKAPSSVEPQVPGTPAWMTDARNAVLLGDLHMKQGKTKEAIETYQKALQQMGQSVTPSSSKEDQVAGLLTAVDVCNKLAAAYVQAGNSDNEASAMLKRASELAKKAEDLTGGGAATANKATEAPGTLPAKLVVTVTKKQLDDVGSGKMTFEAFCKAATVEYVNPPADKK